MINYFLENSGCVCWYKFFCLYSCQFETETGLVQWIDSWKDQELEFKFDLDYQKGVQFVADTWKNILAN